MSIDRGTPEEPDVVGLDSTGQATGAWLVEELGLLSSLIDIDDTTLEIDEEASPLGVPLSVGLSAEQTSPGIGVFDPATGEGNLSTGVDMTLTTLDGGDGPAPIPDPCIATTSFDFTGSIDSDTGELEAHWSYR